MSRRTRGDLRWGVAGLADVKEGISADCLLALGSSVGMCQMRCRCEAQGYVQAWEDKEKSSFMFESGLDTTMTMKG